MTQQFENFVNAALDKSLAADVTLPTANEIPVYTGIGRQVTGKTTTELGLASSSDIETINTTLTSKADLVDGVVPSSQLPSRVNTAASSSDDGYLTSADWSTFNGKQAALADVITADTYGSGTEYPVITFNAKGIATSVTLQTVPTPTFTDATFSVQKNGSPSIAASWDLTALTTSHVHTYPDKDINFNTLSSIGASDDNTLGGTRNRILGGSGNTVIGTDNIAIAAKNCLINGTGNKVYGGSLVFVPPSLSNCAFNNVLNEYGSAYDNSYAQPLFANTYKTNTLDGVTFSGWLNTVVTSVKWPKGYEVRGYKTTTLLNILAAVHTKAYVILNTVVGQPNANVVISDDTSRKPVGLCDEIFIPFTYTIGNQNSRHRLRISGWIGGAGHFRLEREIFVTGAAGVVQISTPVADYADAGVTLTVTASVAAATAGGFYRDLTINVSHDHSLASDIQGTGTLESSMFNVLSFA